MTAAIELRGVSRRYGGTVAVEALDISIEQGEFFTLLGPSGCGKSTTLRMLAGLERPDKGRVLLSGRDVTDQPPERRDVSTVFQDYALFPHMSVADNISFPLRMRHVGRNEVRARVATIIDRVGLVGLERRRPMELSGGQRQRVALARSLVWRPAAILLDEPLAALDRKLRLSMQSFLKDLQRDVGVTFVYVTHDQGEALALSDRLAVLRHGTVRQIGDPQEIYRRPTSIFVADFVGATNLISGTLVGGGHPCRIAVSGSAPVGARPAGPAVREAPTGSAVVVAVRPEWVEIRRAATVHEDGALIGRITNIDHLGATRETIVRSPVGEIRVVALNREDPEALRVGDDVVMRWSAEQAHVFLADDDERLTVDEMHVSPPPGLVDR